METEEVRRAMREAIWEMEMEDEETDQAIVGEDHEGQIRQVRAAAETTGTGDYYHHYHHYYYFHH